MTFVNVLLSSYNGEKYIQQQLDSIMSQNGDIEVHCTVRDDGSTDNTEEILLEYRANHQDKIDLFVGENNIGYAASFLRLLKQSRETEYYAFSDQDDVWDENKLVSAINALKVYDNEPCMYFCNLELVDENLEYLGYMFKNIHVPDKEGRLLENLAAGCTIVLNRMARDILVEKTPSEIVYHDFWIYVVCSFLGRVLYDPVAYIKYRQHSSNQIGARKSRLNIWRNRVNIVRKPSCAREKIARQMLICYGDILNADDINILTCIADYKTSLYKRLGLFFDNRFYMRTVSKQFWYKVHILLGTL